MNLDNLFYLEALQWESVRSAQDYLLFRANARFKSLVGEQDNSVVFNAKLLALADSNASGLLLVPGSLSNNYLWI